VKTHRVTKQEVRNRIYETIEGPKGEQDVKPFVVGTHKAAMDGDYWGVMENLASLTMNCVLIGMELGLEMAQERIVKAKEEREAESA
jgi:hypothetical protein